MLQWAYASYSALQSFGFARCALAFDSTHVFLPKPVPAFCFSLPDEEAALTASLTSSMLRLGFSHGEGSCAILDEGAILQDESPAQVIERPRTRRVAEIVGRETFSFERERGSSSG